jgi:galactose mutarotase-like enzyme
VLHPWANRLDGPQLVDVDHPTIGHSALIPRDAHDLPIHGISLAGAGWRPITGSDGDAVWVEGTLDFSGPEQLQLFPFPHRIVIRVSLSDRELIVGTGIEATGTVPVPVSFGWHPYFAIPDVPRSEWRVSLPVSRHAELDDRMLPTGRTAPCDAIERALGDATYDDFFPQLRGDEPEFLLRGGEWTVRVTFGAGYPVAQVYAPADRDVVAYEPMTAPVAALTTGEGLRRVVPGERFDAEFRIGVERRPL